MHPDTNPVQAFFRKFFGSLFLPTRTFEGLIDEPLWSSALYAVLLFLVFLPLKYLFLTAWQPAMSAMIPHSVFDTPRFQFCPGSSLLCNPLFATGFYAVVIILFVYLAIVLYNAQANPDFFFDRNVPPEIQRQRTHYRIEPAIDQTARVVLDCIAPLLIFSLLPWFGWFIGIAWFSWISGRALTAHYGKLNPQGNWLFSHYNVLTVLRSFQVWVPGKLVRRAQVNMVSICVPVAGFVVYVLPAMILLWK
jgi:hypothetical protein